MWPPKTRMTIPYNSLRVLEQSENQIPLTRKLPYDLKSLSDCNQICLAEK